MTLPGIRTAIITLSDKGSTGERVDESGLVIREMIVTIGASAVRIADLGSKVGRSHGERAAGGAPRSLD